MTFQGIAKVTRQGLFLAVVSFYTFPLYVQPAAVRMSSSGEAAGSIKLQAVYRGSIFFSLF